VLLQAWLSFGEWRGLRRSVDDDVINEKKCEHQDACSRLSGVKMDKVFEMFTQMPTSATRSAGVATTAQTRKAATCAGSWSGTSWTLRTTGLATRQVIHPECTEFQTVFFFFSLKFLLKLLESGC
jgi:hypothetical protein